MAESSSSLTRILFVPNLDSKRGWGHWLRCLSVARSLGPQRVAVLGFPWGQENSQVLKITDQADPQVQILRRPPDIGEFDVVVVDQQATGPELWQLLIHTGAFLVGWDEGGPKRSGFDYLVDSLPNLAHHPANVFLPGLAGARQSSRPFAASIQKILVAFGGGDPANLTLPTLRLLKNSGWLKADRRVVVVKGPGAQFTVPDDELEVWDAPENLADRLGDFDLLIGSWGLGAIEALARGVMVMCAAPTSYHNRLGKKLGLARFSVHSLPSFSRAMNHAYEASQQLVKSFPPQALSATSYWESFLPPAHRSKSSCPACGHEFNPVIARTEKKTYKRCPRCGLEYLLPFQTPPKFYGDAYFFDEYANQYGKTYLDDFPAIKNMGQQRVTTAQRLWGSWVGQRIFDIGCAYGPFMSAAAEAGAQSFGVDISSSAADYVRATLGFQAVTGDFPQVGFSELFPSEALPDVVSMWYVIEHFADLKAVLTKVDATLPTGGKFIFSTPNGHGISRRFSSSKFWNESPSDHWTIWNFQNAPRILKRFGFVVDHIRITGHHPERFPRLFRWPFKSTIRFLDQILGWGDTFEVYARKM